MGLKLDISGHAEVISFLLSSGLNFFTIASSDNATPLLSPTSKKPINLTGLLEEVYFAPLLE